MIASATVRRIARLQVREAWIGATVRVGPNDVQVPLGSIGIVRGLDQSNGRLVVDVNGERRVALELRSLRVLPEQEDVPRIRVQ